MSTTSTGETAADRQRLRAARGTGAKKPSGTANRLPSPPRQRRPALAAIALLLIVGGALIAGLLAVRMDSRVPMLAARQDIEPGAVIRDRDVKVVQVAAEEADHLIPEEGREVIVGAFAKARIYENQLLDERQLTETDPIGQDRAVVSVVLTPALTPGNLQSGDLVQIVRAAGTSGGEGGAAQPLTRGLVTQINTPDADELGGGAAASANIIVPASVAPDVIDASSANLAGLAVISRGNTIDDVLLGP